MTAGVARSRTNDEWLRVPQWKISILFYMLSFLFLLMVMNREVNVYDEALILEGSTRVMSGAVPHRDFYTNYGPGQFYVLGGLFELTGPSVLMERLWDTIVRAGIATAALMLVQRLSTAWQGIFAGTLTLVWLARVQNYAFPLFPSLLFALVACAVIIYTLERRSPLSLIVAGLSGGVTTLFRYDVGFYAVFGITLFLIIFSVSRKHSITRIVQTIALFALGVLIVCAPVAATYVLDGNAPDFYFDIIDFPAHTYPKMRSLPFPDLRSISHSKDLASVYFPPLVWAATVAIAVLTRRHTEPQTRFRRWGMLLLALISLLFYLKGIVRVSVVHLMASIVPALMLATLLIPARQPVSRSVMATCANGLAYAVIAITALLTLQALPFGLSNARSNLQWAASGGMWKTDGEAYDVNSCRPQQAFMRLACFKIDADRGKAIGYIVQNSSPSDTIFEGVPHHDKIFANDMSIYFATGRRPATKWYHFDPGLQTSQTIQERIVADLTTARPRFIVIDATWSDTSEPNGSAVSSGVELLDQFIARNYATVQRFGTISLLSPRDGTAIHPSSEGQ